MATDLFTNTRGFLKRLREASAFDKRIFQNLRSKLWSIKPPRAHILPVKGKTILQTRTIKKLYEDRNLLKVSTH